MVWQENTRVIVMTTREVEKGRVSFKRGIGNNHLDICDHVTVLKSKCLDGIVCYPTVGNTFKSVPSVKDFLSQSHCFYDKEIELLQFPVVFSKLLRSLQLILNIAARILTNKKYRKHLPLYQYASFKYQSLQYDSASCL